MSRSPFFQVMLDLQVAPLASGGAAGRPGPKGISLQPLPVDAGTAKFDLALSLIEPAGIGSDDETLGGFLNYNTDLFDRESIVRMVGHFVTLLEGAVADPDRRLSQLPLLTAAEAAELAAWSAAAAGGETPHTVAEMFEAQASRTPEAVAVVVDGDGRQLTYEALNRRANRLARALMAEGAGPERLVVLLMERSPDMIVAILSVLKAGAAFVPLDPATPRERLAFILEETEAVVVLTEERLRPGLGQGSRVICVDGDWGTLAGVADDNPQPCVEAQSLAYVIYTSGSTGRPKGVLITQGAIAGHIEDVVQHFELSEKDRVLQFAAYTFDQGLEQMLATLVAGGTLVMRGTEVWPAAGFAEVVQRQQLTVINLPPAYWNQVIQAAAGVPAPQLRLIIVGGDALAPEGLRLWAQSPWRQARLLNAYGPTEATITATTHQVSPEVALAERQRPLPIGRPLPRRAAQVLDRHGNPVPIGVAGELTLGGAGLARGYLGRPGLTAERFVPDGSGDGARAYRTGDLVRWLPGGILEFLGRTDQQVKIRGFRVELGEIEAVLSAHPVVQDAVVLVRDDGADGTDGQWMGTGKRLVAYVVPARGTSDVTPGELRAYLEEKLPAYMVPQAFLVLHALPLTASGKVNRRALPAPDPSQAQIETVYVGPRTPIEEDLVVIWRQVLGLEQVGVYDNFFALGGHSLLATQILARLRESYPVELPLRRLFETPTVAGLAETIEEGLVGQEDEEELARLLAELEGLSNEEASRMLGHQARAPGRE
jgi:amino acid adenylation domain-containing protein